MLVEKNVIGGGAFDGAYAEDAFHAPGMKLVVYTAKDLVLDETAFGVHPLRPLPWSGAWCILSGRAIATIEGRSYDLGPGDIVTTNHTANVRFRMDGRGEPYRAAAVVFGNPHDRPLESVLSHGSLHGSELRALDALLPPLGQRCTVPEGRVVLSKARALLRQTGLPFDTIDAHDFERMAVVDAGERAAFEGIGAVLQQLEAQPMLVDLEAITGMSTRNLQRKLAGLQARYQIAPWRQFVSAWRTISACALLSAPQATTERVARAVGYGSPAALCHAFTRAQLPSPGRLRSFALAG